MATPSSDYESFETLNVLIVEDDDDTRKNLRDVLGLHGHQITSRRTFSEAFAVPELGAFDVILLDRKLPDGMVEDCLPTFRGQAPDADLIVITGYADTRASIAALRQGVTDYIIKPIHPDDLLRSLQHIARRRSVERELLKEHEFAETVLQTAEAIVLVLHPDGRIGRFNHYLAEITGYTWDEVRDQDWFDTFIPEKEREQVRGVFLHTWSEQRSRRILNSILTKSGETREIRWSNSAIKDSDANITGVLAIGLDVTELMEAERKARRSDRLATIGQTMAGMAHESRNALQRIRNSVDLLEDELDGNPEALRYVEKISRAGKDLQNLLEEVRGYAAPIHLHHQPVSLPTIWRRAWESLELKSAHAKLVEDIAPAADVPASLDARRMEQVFRNLFENALDACGDRLELHISMDTHDDRIRLRIRDNGPGMSAEIRDHVFDAFFTTKPTGTGLGMAIVHRIIEAHDGSITVLETSPGTAFEIILKLQTLASNISLDLHTRHREA